MEKRKIDIIKSLDEKYRKDFLDLEKCKKFKEEQEQQLKALQTELTITDDNSSIGGTIKKAKKTIQDIEASVTESKLVTSQIEEYLKETDEIRKTVNEHLTQLNSMQCTVQYIKVLKHIEELNVMLQTEVADKNDERCATIFANLSEVFRNIIDLPSTNLYRHLKEVLCFWQNMLKEKFSKDFEEVLKAIKWPFVNTNFSLQTPSQMHIRKLQIISEYLLQIELPLENISPTTQSFDFLPLCLPIYFLVVPLRKRFIYHFYGARQTNRIDKPEWYFTQVLSWIRDHRDFVKTWIQPVIDKFGLHHIDAEVELMRGLVQIAVEKLYSDLPTLQYDDYVFSHSVDEALGFNKELVESYHYPATQPGVLSVLTQAQVFVKWLAMEKKYATEKMDRMFLPAAKDTFQPLLSDVDDLKITACADMFVTLLQTITERYECLPQPGHRLQFLELQLELLDDFRIRLLQVVHAETGCDIVESRVPMIANTLYYVENVLLDWGAMLHYLSLYYYKTQLNKAEAEAASPSSLPDLEEDFLGLETETVFAETLSLYRHMRRDLLCTLAESVTLETKNRSKAYRTERWSMMTNPKNFQSLSLTPTACPMFEVLATRLHQLEKSLTAKLFRIVWRFIAQQLDTYLFDDLVLENRFNEDGAIQLKFDVTRNLLPLFAQFSEKPDIYFTQVIESCNLLNISKGSALLLRETLLALEGATGVEDMRGRALAEIGVTNFTPKMALQILNRRTDITVNRLVID